MTPNWVRTVGVMIDEEVLVYAFCRKCRNQFTVDLEAIAALKGRDYSLLGRYPKCKITTCDGQCFFQYSPAEGTPLRPLPDE